MAKSGRVNFKSDSSAISGYVEWSSNFSSGNSHEFTYTIYGGRVDGWSATTWCNVSQDGSFIYSPPSQGTSSVVRLCEPQTIIVTSNGAGLMTTKLSVDIGFTSEGFGDVFANCTITGIQLDIPPRILTIVTPTGTKLTCSKTNGSTVYYGDTFTVTAGAVTGYNTTTFTVSGATESDGTYTVQDNVTIVASATVKSYTITIKNDNNSSIEVTRTRSPLQDAESGPITTGEIVYYSDVLEIVFRTNEGYSLATSTVNGSEFDSGDTYTVYDNVSIVSSSKPQSFKLILSPGVGSEIIVNRLESPLQGASTDKPLKHESDIYYSDKLEIIFKSTAGYKLITQRVNQDDFVSGDTYIVYSDVEIVTITDTSGLVRIYNGNTFEPFIICIYNGNDWDQYIPYVYNGSSWDICS